jgi:lipopolysaccharide export system protein LptA
MMRHLPNKLIIGLLMLLPSLGWALPSDSQKPINIEADYAQLDDKLGITQYKGRAILTQGTLRIEGDIITFYYDANKQLKKAVAQGNLATYQQLQKQGEAPVKARGLKMEYLAGGQKIYLIGKGYVWQNGDEFKGDYIVYDIEKNVVNASSRPVKINNRIQPSSGRVHIIIDPNAPATTPKVKATPKSTTKPQNQEATDSTNDSVAVEEQETEDGYPVRYTATRLNVRTGPGTQHDKLDTFPGGSEVIVLTEQNDWRQVRGVVNGKVIIGWVHKDYITK